MLVSIHLHTKSLSLFSCPQLLKKLKRPHEAVLNFSWALDFSRHSGGNSHIREEVDEMYQVSEGDGRNEDFFAHSDGEDDLEQQQYDYEGEED